MKIFVCLFVIFVGVCFGQTETAVEDDCDKACPFNYEPVCCTYSDGSTLSHGNACAAEVYNCNEKITPTATNDGECEALTVEPATEPTYHILPFPRPQKPYIFVPNDAPAS